MIKQGFIKEIGEPRTFTDKDGNARHAYPVVCDFPYTTQNGRDATDELVADLYADNPEYIEQVRGIITQNRKCELTLYFSVSLDSKGRKWQRLSSAGLRIPSPEPYHRRRRYRHLRPCTLEYLWHDAGGSPWSSHAGLSPVLLLQHHQSADVIACGSDRLEN